TVGGKPMIDLLETTAKLSNGTPLTYALGLTVDQYRGVRRVSHGGAWGGFRAMTMRFPAQRLSVYTLCNRGDAARFAGSYFADGNGQMVNFDARGDTLVQRGNGVALAPLGPGRFRHVSGSTFRFRDDGVK